MHVKGEDLYLYMPIELLLTLLVNPNAGLGYLNAKSSVLTYTKVN